MGKTNTTKYVPIILVNTVKIVYMTNVHHKILPGDKVGMTKGAESRN